MQAQLGYSLIVSGNQVNCEVKIGRPSESNTTIAAVRLYAYQLVGVIDGGAGTVFRTFIS